MLPCRAKTLKGFQQYVLNLAEKYFNEQARLLDADARFSSALAMQSMLLTKLPLPEDLKTRIAHVVFHEP